MFCKNKNFLRYVISSVILGVLTGYASAQPAPVDEIRPGVLRGYLVPSELPNALGILPPAPAGLGAGNQQAATGIAGYAPVGVGHHRQ